MDEELCKHTGKPFACATCDGRKFSQEYGVKQRLHMSQSVTGPLRIWKKADWKRMAKCYEKQNGNCPSGDELKEEFMDHLSQGHEVFPIGECNNFCFKNGCLGHRIESEVKT